MDALLLGHPFLIAFMVAGAFVAGLVFFDLPRGQKAPLTFDQRAQELARLMACGTVDALEWASDTLFNSDFDQLYMQVRGPGWTHDIESGGEKYADHGAVPRSVIVLFEGLALDQKIGLCNLVAGLVGDSRDPALANFKVDVRTSADTLHFGYGGSIVLIPARLGIDAFEVA